MSGTRYGPEPISTQGLLQVIVVLQLVIVVGLVVVFLQFDGLPDRVAEHVPTDPGAAGEIFTLQQSVDQISTKVDLILEAVHPTPPASPVP
jgi:hypothetical protein